jgi:hypothetical protein
MSQTLYNMLLIVYLFIETIWYITGEIEIVLVIFYIID